jgi:hypothetical protein
MVNGLWPISVPSLSRSAASGDVGQVLDELRRQLAVADSLVKRRGPNNKLIKSRIEPIVGKPPKRRIKNCVILHHSHGGYRLVTGASDNRCTGIGFLIQFVSGLISQIPSFLLICCLVR